MAVRSGTSEKPAATLQEMKVLSCVCGHLRIFLLELDDLLSTSAECANCTFPSEKELLLQGRYPGCTVAELVNSIFSPSHRIDSQLSLP